MVNPKTLIVAQTLRAKLDRQIKRLEAELARVREFKDLVVALLDDDEISSVPVYRQIKLKAGSTDTKMLEVLHKMLTENKNSRMIKIADWQAECARHGIFDIEKPNSSRALFSRHKRKLLAAHFVAVDAGNVVCITAAPSLPTSENGGCHD